MSERDEDDSRQFRRRNHALWVAEKRAPRGSDGANADAVPPAVPGASTTQSQHPTSQRPQVEDWLSNAIDDTKLPALLAIDVAEDVEAAPAVFKAITRIGGTYASAQLRQTAAARVAQILASERLRVQVPGARGAVRNMVLAIDALGDMRTPEADVELLHALESEKYALHHETHMVQELANRHATFRAAIEQFESRTKARVSEDPFERKLQNEAQEAAREALSRIKN